VDAAADAGVKFIVHLGIFGNGRMTNPVLAWHEMVERYSRAVPKPPTCPIIPSAGALSHGFAIIQGR
jgi:hypothetical protein